jgi:hypothetical protein
MCCEMAETNGCGDGRQSSVNCQESGGEHSGKELMVQFLGEHGQWGARTLAEGWHNLLVP